MMTTSGEVNSSTARLLFYNVEDDEKQALIGLLDKASIQNLEVLQTQEMDTLERPGSNTLTEQQRLLLCLYLHLYAVLRGRNALQDERLGNIRECLGISHSFAGFAVQYMRSIEPKSFFGERSPIASVVEPNEKLANWADGVVYAACKDGRFVNKSPLHGLDPREYEHPYDKKALDSLQGTPGLETLIRKFYQYGTEKMLRVQYTGSNIKVTQNNFPGLHRALCQVCEVLDLPHIPDLYIKVGFLNSFTAGVEKPIIVLLSGCVGLLSYDELLFIMGHEVGHIKSQHVLYHQMAEVLPYLGDIIGSATLGIGGLVATGIQVALLDWQRKSEFTADRAGLLACQNVEAAASTMMKLAGVPPKFYNMINTEHFREQVRDFKSIDMDNLGKIAKKLSVMFATHPWLVMRAAELFAWTESGGYDSVIGNHVQSPLFAVAPDSQTIPAKNRFCTKCGAAMKENIKFCTKCGAAR